MSRHLPTAGFTRVGRPSPRALAASALMAACTAGLLLCGSPAVCAADDLAQKTGPTAPMSVDWKYTGTAFPNNTAVPIVSGDSIYFASGGRVYALKTATGSLKWRYPYDGNLPSPVTNSPALAGDTLLLPTGDGLYALDTADGKLKYPAFKVARGGITSSPIVIGENVYFESGEGKLYGINIQTGQPLEGKYKAGLATGDLAGDLTADAGILYFVTANSILHAVDVGAGVQRWSHPFPVSGRVTPVVSGESVYAATGQALVVLRTANGSERWRQPTRNEITAPPAVDADGNIYLITSDRGVYAIDGQKRPLWKRPPHTDYQVETQPVVVNNLVIVGTAFGGLYAFDRATGDLKWNYAIRPSSLEPTGASEGNRANVQGGNQANVQESTKVDARPVSAGDTLYVLTDDGTLTAFRHDAIDGLPPLVDHLEPTQGDYLNGRPPFDISAHIQDDGSGLNQNTITLKVDGNQIRRGLDEQDILAKPGFLFKPDEGLLTYTIQESDTGLSRGLTDGHHTVIITASDWKGNTVNKSWTFYVDDTIKPRVKRTNTSAAGGRGGAGRPGVGGGKGGGGGGG
jgi:outer membrane protein assembly factor BamB